MFITDGKSLIIHDSNDSEKLEEAIEKLEKQLKSNEGIVSSWELDEDSKPFPFLAIPEGITYTMIYRVLAPNFILKAINEKKRFQKPDTRLIECKHIFDDKEKLNMGQETAEAHLDKGRSEAELKEKKAQYNAAIQSHEHVISTNSELMAKGYTYREKECYEIIDFEDGKKLFLDIENNELVKTEDLTEQDRQLQMFTTDIAVAPDKEEKKDEKFEEELEEEEDFGAEKEEADVSEE